jgi:hypothetical protein
MNSTHYALRRTVTRAWLWAALLLCCVPAYAQLPFAVGDDVRVNIEVDPSQPGSTGGQNNGILFYQSSIQRIEIAVGDYTAAADGAYFYIRDSTTTALPDSISIESVIVQAGHNLTGADVGGLPLYDLRMGLVDYSRTAITSTAMPLALPNPDQFDTKRGWLGFQLPYEQPPFPEPPEPPVQPLARFDITMINDISAPSGNTFAWEFLGVVTSVGEFPTAPKTPEERISDLTKIIVDFNLQQGIDQSFDAKLSNALSALTDMNDNNDTAAVNSLYAFIHSVEAQRGHKLTGAQADNLIDGAQAIIDQLNQQ